MYPGIEVLRMRHYTLSDAWPGELFPLSVSQRTSCQLARLCWDRVDCGSMLVVIAHRPPATGTRGDTDSDILFGETQAALQSGLASEQHLSHHHLASKSAAIGVNGTDIVHPILLSAALVLICLREPQAAPSETQHKTITMICGD